MKPADGQDEDSPHGESFFTPFKISKYMLSDVFPEIVIHIGDRSLIMTWGGSAN